MVNVIGYGEDALTYCAVTSRLPELLGHLNDATDLGEALVFYRPSFGRAASSGVSPAGHIASAFGEFDAIVATSVAIYLIESKWKGSSGMRHEAICLGAPQSRRHEVFTWYVEMWRSSASNSWDEFVASRSAEFEAKFKHMMMPSSSSTLGRNLAYTLGRLTSISTQVKNVLLYFNNEQDIRRSPLRVEAACSLPFHLVTMGYSPLDGSDQFLMR